MMDLTAEKGWRTVLAMTIELKPEQERRIQELMKSGRFHSVDEVLERALETFSPPEISAEERVRRARLAGAHIRELRKGLSLDGITIKDLIGEGRM
jgi:Arc/MetJ-type ribon-helix-helix transcriptional regulator